MTVKAELESVLYGPDIDKDLNCSSRTRRNYIEAGIIPPADGNFAGRPFWRQSTYAKFKADLLAGKFAKPGRRPPTLRNAATAA